MRLGLNVGYLTAATTPADTLVLVREAERLGYAVVWAAEAYGSDSPSLLAWLAGQTSRIELGSAVMQIPARTPAATAMTAATIDALSGGRFRLGLGVTGPQVSEGWHGVPFADPLGRTREYVEIVRMALARQRVSYAGRHWQLPLPGGAGKALKLNFRPPRRRYRSTSPRSGREESASSPERSPTAGWRSFSRRSTPASSWTTCVPARVGDLSGFDVVAAVPVVIGETSPLRRQRYATTPRSTSAGWVRREHNFYHRSPPAMGTARPPTRCRALPGAAAPGRRRGGAARVHRPHLAAGAGPRIAERLRAYADAGVTTLSVMLFAGDPEADVATLRTVVEAAEQAGVGG